MTAIGQGTPGVKKQALPLRAPAEPSAAKEALTFVSDVFVGFGQGVMSMGEGVVQVLEDPKATFKGLSYLADKLVSDPMTTVHIVGKAFSEPFIEAEQQGHVGRAIGMGMAWVASLFLTPDSVVSGIKGISAMGSAALHGVALGKGLGATGKAMAAAATYSYKATSAARDAERLAWGGNATEAAQMALYAKRLLGVSEEAKSANIEAMGKALAAVAPEATVKVAGAEMKTADFLAYSRKLLKWGSFGRLEGSVPDGVYSAAADASKARKATLTAEKVLAGGSNRPTVLAEMGRKLTRNPMVIAPLVPALGVLPDVLGRLQALPHSLLSGKGLAPAQVAALVAKNNVDPSPANVHDFLREVGAYSTSGVVGPGLSTPAQIQVLQALLEVAGYEVKPSPEGKWDLATSEAVYQFKKANHIHQNYHLVNGQWAINQFVDQKTFSLLISQVNDKALKAKAEQTMHPTT